MDEVVKSQFLNSFASTLKTARKRLSVDFWKNAENFPACCISKFSENHPRCHIKRLTGKEDLFH